MSLLLSMRIHRLVAVVVLGGARRAAAPALNQFARRRKTDAPSSAFNALTTFDFPVSPATSTARNPVARISPTASPVAPVPPARQARDFIRANLPLCPLPFLDGLRLHRAGPTSGLGQFAARRGRDGYAPYWAYAWGGGLALARYLLDHPELVADRRVLDLGAGGGLVAIAAMKAGARSATAIDIDPDALAAIALNAEANGVAVAAICGDPLDGAPPDVDLALVGDLFYEATQARRTTAFLARCRAVPIAVLIGDPFRAHLPRERLIQLADYAIADFGDAPGAATASAVFAFD
jgi:predicted nicotinamide N-methyase